MSRRSQKRAGWALALVSCLLLVGLGALTARYMDAKFPGAEHATESVLPNIDAVAVLAAVALIALAAILYFALGRPVKPRAGATARQTVLKSGMHPAVFGRLCRWKRQNSTDLAATIIRLIQKGVIRVERGVRTDARGKETIDYLLSRTQPVAAGSHSASSHPVDDAAVKMVFDIVAGGKSSVWLGEIHSFGRHNADAFSQAMRTWQATVVREVKRSNCFNRSSETAHIALLGLAVAAVLAGLLATLGSQSFVPVACGVVSGVALWLASRQMPQHTPAGADAYDSAKALRAWLRSASAEELADDRFARSFLGQNRSVLDLMPYAYVLREMGALCDAHPGLAEFCDELTVCIGSTAFAAESTVAYQNLRALNSPVRGITLDHDGVTGLANPEEDSDELFVRRV